MRRIVAPTYDRETWKGKQTERIRLNSPAAWTKAQRRQKRRPSGLGRVDVRGQDAKTLRLTHQGHDPA